MTTEVLKEETASVRRVEGSPFKFLDYYGEADASDYAGRDRDIRIVISRITKEETFILYGRSGLGKTSLVLAGIFPRLRERGFWPIYVRTLESPVADLYSTVAAAAASPLPQSQDEFRELLKECATAGPVVLVLDQFEEFFIRFREDPQQRRHFIREIADLIETIALDVRVVFSLREDYLAEMDDFRRYLPGLFDNEYRLQLLTAFGARQAIERPLINAGVPYDQQLLAALVDQLAEVGFDPPLLQITCSELYRRAQERAQGKPHLTKTDLEQLGGLEGIFRRFLDDVISQVPAEQHLLLRTVLDALITRENTKQATTLAGLMEAEFVASESELASVMSLLTKQRLVRGEERSGTMWYELIHERLVAIVLQWLELDQDFFNFRVARELIDNSSRGEIWRQKPETLLNAGQLRGVIDPFKERLRVQQLQCEFVLSSVIYRRTEDVSYWSNRFGQDNTLQVLLHMMGDGDAEVRRGAAVAAKQIEDSSGALADHCLELSLRDSDEGVRRAAGSSLAMLAKETHLQCIRSAIGDRKHRVAALHLAADFHAAERSLGRIRRWQQWRARRIASKRKVAAHADIIRQRANRGALSGLLGGLAWMVFLGPLVTTLLLLEISPTLEPDFTIALYLVSPLIAVVIVTALSPLVGWRVSASAAVHAVLQDRECWGRAVLHSWTCFFVLLVPTGLLGMTCVVQFYDTYFDYNRDGIARVGLVIYLIALGILFATPVVLLVQGTCAACVRLSRPAVCSPSRRPLIRGLTLWLWSLLSSAGLPLLVNALVATAAITLWDARWIDNEVVSVCFFFGALTLSWLTAVSTIAVGRSAQRASVLEEVSSSVARWGGRMTLGVFIVLTFTWFFTVFGTDTIPWVRTRHQLSSEDSLTIGLGPGYPDATYFRLQNDSESVVAAYLIADRSGREVSGLAINGERIELYRPTDQVFLFPPNKTVEASVGPSDSSLGQLLSYKLQFGRAAVLPPAKSNRLNSLKRDSWQYVECVCVKRDDSNVWVGSVGGRVDPTSTDDLALLAMSQDYLIRTVFKGNKNLQDTLKKFGASDEFLAANEALEEFGSGGSDWKITLIKRDTPSSDDQGDFLEPTQMYYRLDFPITDRTYEGFRSQFPEEPERFGWLIPVELQRDGRWQVEIEFSLREAYPRPIAEALKGLKVPEEKIPNVATKIPKNSYEIRAFLRAKLTSRVAIDSREYWHRGNELVSSGSRDKGIQLLRRAVSSDPADLEYREDLIEALLDTSRYDEALEEAQAAVRLEANVVNLDLLAHAAYGAKQYETAVEAWDRILVRDDQFFILSDNWRNHDCKWDRESYKLAKEVLRSREAAPDAAEPAKAEE